MSRILTILGPTAAGKTALAVAVAKKLDGAILSADSRQVFRGMDIGTGKDLGSYGTVPRFLVDIRPAGASYHVSAYRADFLKALSRVRELKKVPILCGGSGLYIQAALQGLPFADIPVNRELRRRLETLTQAELLARFHDTPSAYSVYADTSTRKRLIRAIEIGEYLRGRNSLPSASLPSFRDDRDAPEVPASFRPGLTIGIQLPLSVRRERITVRLHQRLKEGLLEEVKALLDQGVPAEKLIFYGLEYKFAVLYLQGVLDYETMTVRLNTAIHQFAKRQMTFFRKLEKDGLPIIWIDGTQTLQQQLEAVLQRWEEGGG